MILAPSNLARRVASREWPDVQTQRKVAPGVFGFSCAGHGGLIGIVPAMANLTPDVLAVARETGFVDTWTVTRRRKIETYHPSVFRHVEGASDEHRRQVEGNIGIRASWIAAGFEVEEVEVWIGEEDCGWATLCVVPGVVEGLVRSGWVNCTVEQLDWHGCLARWSGDFAAAVGV